MNNLKVLISILNWNSWNNTIETVNSVLQSDYRNYKIIILDNHSVDDSYNIIIATFPDIDVWHFNNNLGYAGAHKKAALFAAKNNYDLLWMLNNDVQVFPFALKELVLAYERNGNALLGSVSLEADGETIQFGGGAEIIDNFNNDESVKYNHFGGKKLFETDMVERPVSDLIGASILIPVSLIKKYGFIDTKYFLYGEETDYSYRLRRKFGIQSIIVPKSIIIHTGGESLNMCNNLLFVKTYYQTRNINYLYKKYFKSYSAPLDARLRHLIKFFFKHYLLNEPKEKDNAYWLKFYKKLGYFHAIIGIRGKYLEPNKFIIKEKYNK